MLVILSDPDGGHSTDRGSGLAASGIGVASQLAPGQAVGNDAMVHDSLSFFFAARLGRWWLGLKVAHVAVGCLVRLLDRLSEILVELDGLG